MKVFKLALTFTLFALYSSSYPVSSLSARSSSTITRKSTRSSTSFFPAAFRRSTSFSIAAAPLKNKNENNALLSRRDKEEVAESFQNGGYYSSASMKEDNIKDGDDDKAANNDHEYYDYILVGGGAAGCVLAYRLDKMGYKVLMLERGPHADEIANAHHANGWPACWNSKGVKEMVYDDGKITLVGNTLGGGTTINVGVTWEETSPFYSKNFGSKWWSSSDMENAILQMRKKVDPSILPIDNAIKEFADGLQTAYPDIQTLLKGNNDNHPRSFQSNSMFRTWNAFQEYPQCHGEYYRKGPRDIWRESSARTIHSVSVERLLFDGDDQEEKKFRRHVNQKEEDNDDTTPPRAIGVEYIENAIRGISQSGNPNRKKKKALLTKGGEVILSAGTLASPCLLMHNGIGPEDNLRDFGINVRVPLEEVGRNYIDRPIVPLLKTFTMPSKERSIMVPAIATTKGGGGFMELSGGNTFECMLTTLTFLPRFLSRLDWVRAFVRIALKALRKVLQKHIDQSLIVGCSICKVHTRGRVMLQSKDPNDPLRIMNRFLSDPRDLEAMNKVVKMASNGLQCATNKPGSLLNSKGPIDFILNRLLPNLRIPKTDEQIPAFSKRNSSSFYHLFGTCAVGKVVDETLAVHGVTGLRVCDGSIFPINTMLNPQQAIMTMAWRAADIFVQTRDTVP